ncbi:MAG: nucleotidyltransferase family protein [Pigmentiphaga sp.]|nr:nucleotidyltransferase family protein [Pigmentiphaga sp.]
MGILLAAGHGRRFAALSGGADKLLAPLPGGMAVAAASARALLAAVEVVVAVVRPDSRALAAVLQTEGCRVLMAAQAREGMGASLAAAADHWRSAGAAGMACAPGRVLVALADMPWIRPETHAKVLAGMQRSAIAAPLFEGERGHPVAFDASLLSELAALRGETGARDLIRRHGLALVATDDPGVLRDVDTPLDLDSPEA